MRLDRGMYTQPLWFGLFATGLWVITHDSPDQQLPHRVDAILGALFALSATICLTASLCGTKHILPNLPLHTIYKAEMIGLTGISTIMFIDALVTKIPLLVQFTMAGSLGAIIQIGSLKMLAHLWLAIAKQPNP